MPLPSATSATVRPGLTLGLCLSRGVARQHGGELMLGPADGGGRVAEFTLPRSAAVASLESAA